MMEIFTLPEIFEWRVVFLIQVQQVQDGLIWKQTKYITRTKQTKEAKAIKWDVHMLHLFLFIKPFSTTVEWNLWSSSVGFLRDALHLSIYTWMEIVLNVFMHGESWSNWKLSGCIRLIQITVFARKEAFQSESGLCSDAL